MRRNYKSDFHFIMKLYAQVRKEDGTIEKREVFWPEHDWTARLYTSIGLNAYIVSRKGDVLTNCFNDNGRIHVVCNNHGIGKGRLQCEFHAEIPNGLYPDGIEDLYEPQLLDIELVAGQGDCATQAEVDLILPYIKGDAFTYSDFTSEQKVELIAPIKESIDKAITDKQDKLRVTSDFDLSENLLSLTEAGKTALFNDMWASIGGTKLDNGSYRMGDDGKELTYEKALMRYERNRFIGKWNTACGTYGQYNEATECFELNGLTDITYKEAIDIIRAGEFSSSNISETFTNRNIRTNLPPLPHGLNTKLDRTFSDCSYLEIANAGSGYTLDEHSFYRCGNLKKIVGDINFNSDNLSPFMLCKNLSSVNIRLIRGVTYTLKLHNLPLLDFSSVKYMIDSKTGMVLSVKATLIFHKDVYAKLTGDTTNAAAAALTADELAQWQAIATSAAKKNITIATT